MIRRWRRGNADTSLHVRASKLYLVLRRPSIERHIAAYEKAKNLLHKIPMTHEMYEDEDVEALSA